MMLSGHASRPTSPTVHTPMLGYTSPGPGTPVLSSRGFSSSSRSAPALPLSGVRGGAAAAYSHPQVVTVGVPDMQPRVLQPYRRSVGGTSSKAGGVNGSRLSTATTAVGSQLLHSDRSEQQTTETSRTWAMLTSANSAVLPTSGTAQHLTEGPGEKHDSHLDDVSVTNEASADSSLRALSERLATGRGNPPEGALLGSSGNHSAVSNGAGSAGCGDDEDRLFDKIDQNHDGFISREELAGAMGRGIVQEDVDASPDVLTALALGGGGLGRDEEHADSDGARRVLASECLRQERQRLLKDQERLVNWLKTNFKEQVKLLDEEHCEELRTRKLLRERERQELYVQQCREKKIEAARQFRRDDSWRRSAKEASVRRVEDRRSVNAERARRKQNKSEALVEERKRLEQIRLRMRNKARECQERFRLEIDRQRIDSKCDTKKLLQQVDALVADKVFTPEIIIEDNAVALSRRPSPATSPRSPPPASPSPAATAKPVVRRSLGGVGGGGAASRTSSPGAGAGAGAGIASLAASPRPLW